MAHTQYTFTWFIFTIFGHLNFAADFCQTLSIYNMYLNGVDANCNYSKQSWMKKVLKPHQFSENNDNSVNLWTYIRFDMYVMVDWSEFEDNRI